MLTTRLAVLLLSGLIAAMLAGLAPPRDAQAHAVLERSLPVQNQQLEGPPELVEAWFSEPLERSLTTLEVLDTQGNTLHVGDTLFSDDPLYAAVRLSPDAGPDIYTVTYQNVSTVDGHTWAGFFTFIILNPDGSIPTGQAYDPGGLGGQVGFLPDNADGAMRWLGLIAAAVLGGAAAFVVLIAWPAARFMEDERAEQMGASVARMLPAAGLPAAILLLASNGGQVLLLANNLGGLGRLDDILLSSRTGELYLARAGLAVALLLVLAPLSIADLRPGAAKAIAWLTALGGSGLLMTYSLSSHANAGGGAFWAVSSDFVHFAATAAWLGGLLFLVLAFQWTRGRLEEPERSLYLANVLDRFSWLAVISVALLIGTGAFNSFVQLPTVASLWETTYGRVLIAKLALIVPLLGMAGFNSLYLKPRLVEAIDALHGAADSEEEAAEPERTSWEAQLQRLRWALPRTAVAELLLGVAVLAGAAVLAQSTTADGELRIKASEPGGDFVGVSQTEDLNVELTVSPFIIGVNTYTVRLEPKAGEELGGVLRVQLTARLDDPGASLETGTSGTRQELGPTDDPQVFQADAALLTRPGDWSVEVGVRRRGHDDLTTNIGVPEVGVFLARARGPEELFDLPFTFVDWNIAGGGALLTLGFGAILIWRNRPLSWRQSASTAFAASGSLAILSGIVLLFGVHAHEGSVPRTSPFPITQESLAIGRGLYENNCQVCHGPRGQGGELGPDMTVHVPAHGDAFLFVRISDGFPVNSDEQTMPSFSSEIPEEERWHLVNFLRTEFGGEEVPFVLPPTPTNTPEASPPVDSGQ
jgi:copper transport protein